MATKKMVNAIKQKPVKMTISVYSSVLKQWYKITRFTDYDVAVDLDTDVDQFSFTFDNPESIFCGLVSGMDKVKVCIGDKNSGLMLGYVDKVNYEWDYNSSSITITGRDKAQLLTDNDCNPMSKKNINPKDFIGGLCKKTGIKYVAHKTLSTVSNFELSTGTSYLNAIVKALEKSRQDYWFLYDTLHTGSFNYGGESKWKFVRGVGGGINILKMSVNEDYSDVKSGVRIYGSNDSGDSVFSGSTNLPIVKKRGYTKISVENKDDDTSKNTAVKTAKKELNDNWRDAFSITITVKADRKFMPNNCCTVVDKYNGINARMFIRGVRYICNTQDGHICELTLVPATLTMKKLKDTKNIMYSLCSTNQSSLNAKIKKVLTKYAKKWS